MRNLIFAVLLIPVLLPDHTRAAPAYQLRADTCVASIDPDTTMLPIPRSFPWTFHDQARASIAALHPQHRMLAERRDGSLMRIEYSMVVFQATPTDSVSLQALAVDRTAQKVWYLRSRCTLDNWPAGMINMIESVAALQK